MTKYVPTVAAFYSEPHRHYHTRQHIESMLALLAEWEVHAMRTELITAACWFHDAVYEPRGHKNERHSAKLARHMLRDDGWNHRDADLVAEMVLQTAHHRWTDKRYDTALFLDLDLAILGAEPARYDDYARQIRAEYAHVPEDVYRGARVKVLGSFLDRPVLFFTPMAQERFEYAARDNLKREIGELWRG